ncbi:MAG: zinc-dependent alcohol dehydrogenase family protein [Chloroflexota bacterium]
MKAMRLIEPAEISKHPLRMQEVPKPEPGPDQIRISVSVCGVCHTDLHTVEGELDLPTLPLTPGHQIVGVVDMVGEAVQRFSPGQRVGVAWLNQTCGSCYYCLNCQENLCRKAKFTGLNVDGGYADYVIVDENFAFELPNFLSDEEASPLLCAGIIGYRSLRLSGIQPGRKLGLYGFGASAHLAIQVAHFWNCEVYVFTRSEELVPLALEHLRPGGTLAINAIHMSPIPQFDYKKIYDERILRSVTNFTRQDALEFLALAASIPIHTATEMFPLEEANQVLRRLKKSEIRGAAVLQVK